MAETTNHFILHCPITKVNTKLSSPAFAVRMTFDQNDNNIIKIFPYGLDNFSETENTSILNAAMEFLIHTTVLRNNCIRII